MQSKTSLLAYIEVLENLGEKQLIVLQTIKKLGECNNKMIANELGWEINRVTGRVNELHKDGAIINSKTDFCPITLVDEHKERLTKFWKMRRNI